MPIDRHFELFANYLEQQRQAGHERALTHLQWDTIPTGTGIRAARPRRTAMPELDAEVPANKRPKYGVDYS